MVPHHRADKKGLRQKGEGGAIGVEVCDLVGFESVPGLQVSDKICGHERDDGEAIQKADADDADDGGVVESLPEVILQCEEEGVEAFGLGLVLTPVTLAYHT